MSPQGPTIAVSVAWGEGARMENSSMCSACTKRGCREAGSQLCEDFHWALKCFLNMAFSDFLKDLPSRNAENFTKINPNSCNRLSTGKKAAYIPVKDIPADQVIVNEKVKILRGYLHQKWDKRAANVFSV